MNPKRPVRIGVIGGNTVDEKLYGEAEEVGRLLAKAGADVYCGGMGGVMEAVCKGAHAEGGRSIALLPDDSIERANPYVTVPIATGMGFARNYIIVHNSDAVIAIGGAEGTLNEMAASLNMGLTVVSLHSWEVDKIGTMRRGRLLHAATAKEAVRLALENAGKRTDGRPSVKRTRTS